MIFGERSEPLRRTILASEASRSENDFGERSKPLGERFWRAKRGIQYTQKIFGKRSEPLGEQFWRVKRSVIFPPNLGGKPPSFYFSKKNPTCWGGYLQKITLVFFYENTPQLIGGFTFKK